jgi:beta-galactosidase
MLAKMVCQLFYLLQDCLPNLQRGPTPATVSYTVTRKPVSIVKATAGANADSAFASYDDNELSDWVNDGKLGTAWVEYELEKEST